VVVPELGHYRDDIVPTHRGSTMELACKHCGPLARRETFGNL
jgi:hypothetical protein